MRRVKLKHDVHHVWCQGTKKAEPTPILIDYDDILNYKTANSGQTPEVI